MGKICESGAGGTTSVRGVGAKTINFIVFNDESNTAVPGLKKEFVQFAKGLRRLATPLAASTGDTS